MTDKEVKIKITADTAKAKSSIDSVGESLHTATGTIKQTSAATEQVKQSTSGAASGLGSMVTAAKGFIGMEVPSKRSDIDLIY